MSTAIKFRAACHPDAWAYFKSYYLRPVRPSLAGSYDALLRMADEMKWGPIPSISSLRRRLTVEVPAAMEADLRAARWPVWSARS